MGAALVSSERVLSWDEVDERVAEARKALEDEGIARGDRVALVSASRGFDEAIGLFALLASGVTVVPLDATAPPARLASICDARAVKKILHDDAAAGLVAKVEALRSAREKIEDAKVSGGDLACILHTSGTTGAPKPVPITREGLDAFIDWTIDLLDLREGDRVLRVAELVFDLAWFDHVATWKRRAALICLDRREMAAGRALADAIARHRPSVVYGVPSMFMKLTSALKEGETLDARAVMFAGEVFPPRELQAFARRAPNARLFNLYGPTETNVCTYHEVDRSKLDGVSELPIGAPTPYAQCRVDGGELVVSGPTTIGGGPHRTGDRVVFEHGVYWFKGRVDRMVKIRGYRVEPSEVEATLAKHAAVRQAAIVPHDHAKLGKILRGYVAVSKETTEKELKMFLASLVPPYMVPEKIVLLDELPRTTTGKIDYARLSLGAVE